LLNLGADRLNIGMSSVCILNRVIVNGASMNTSINIKMFLCISLLLLVSACTSMPKIFSFTEQSNSLEVSDGEKPTFIETNDNVDLNFGKKAKSSITQAELKYTQQKVDDFLIEWHAMKPEINRVIQLEGELTYLVDLFNKSSGMEFYSDRENELLENVSASELASVTTKSLADKFTSPERAQSADTDAQSTEVDPTTLQTNGTELKAQLGKAKPLLAIEQPSKANDGVGVSDSKFSSLSAPTISPDRKLVRAVVSTQNIIGNPSKFSNESDRSIKTTDDIQDTCENVSVSDGGFAIHLSSLSNAANVPAAVHQLSKNLADVLCNKKAKMALVKVNGIDYSSIRFGPYLSRESATQACNSIRVRGNYCKVTTFDGQSI